MVQLPAEGNGERVNADVSVDPIPDLIRLSRVKTMSTSSSFVLYKRK
jgi:hypothetical protein